MNEKSTISFSQKLHYLSNTDFIDRFLFLEELAYA